MQTRENYNVKNDTLGIINFGKNVSICIRISILSYVEYNNIHVDGLREYAIT